MLSLDLDRLVGYLWSILSLSLSRIQWANCAGIEETEESRYFLY